MSSAICPGCKKGYITKNGDVWICFDCKKEVESMDIEPKIKCCSDKLEVISE